MRIFIFFFFWNKTSNKKILCIGKNNMKYEAVQKQQRASAWDEKKDRNAVGYVCINVEMYKIFKLFFFSSMRTRRKFSYVYKKKKVSHFGTDRDWK